MDDATFAVVRTSDRQCTNDYQVQLPPERLNRIAPGASDGDLLTVSTTDGALAVHARAYRRDDLGTDEAGVDFSLRYALGITAKEDVEYGEGRRGDRVRVAPADERRRGRLYGFFDWLLGVRTEVCRVRMAVHPDLENDVCRIPETTMDLLGIEKGDAVVIESTDGMVEGVKALTLDDEIRERKDHQRERDERRYPDCYEKLDLERIRATGEDLPEIFLDAEVRSALGLAGVGEEGVCHPVRVYRDTVNVFVRHLHTFAAPLVFVLVGTAIRIDALWLSLVLFAVAAVLGTLVVIYQGRQLLR